MTVRMIAEGLPVEICSWIARHELCGVRLRAIASFLRNRLASLGPVEIVVADADQVRTLIEPTRDVSVLAAALEELSPQRAGLNAIERIRNAVTGNTSSVELRRSDKVAAFETDDYDALPGTEESSWLMVDPIGSQDHLAAASGGGVTVGSAGLRARLDQSPRLVPSELPGRSVARRRDPRPRGA